MGGPICLNVFYAGSQALFVQASMLNHSCQPNAVASIPGRKADGAMPLGGETAVGEGELGSGQAEEVIVLKLRTLRPVAKGEELTIDYIPELAMLQAGKRRDLLEQDY